MAAPAIETVYDQIFTLVAAAVPTIRPATKFVRVTDFVDLEETPPPSATRKFDVDYGGTDDRSAQGQGVQTPGVADRTATLLLSVVYSVTQDARDVEKMLASDVEILMRAVQKIPNWGAAPVSRCLPKAHEPKRDYQEGSIVIQPIELQVFYRDTE